MTLSTGQNMIRSVLLAVIIANGLSAAATAQRPQLSPEASAHLTEIVSLLQKQWLYRDKTDWDAFRRRVLAQAGSAQTIAETYDAIRLALTLLGDRHSWYRPQSGDTIPNPQSPTQSTGECTPAPLVTPPLPANVGYVRIQITPETPTAEIQDSLRKQDNKELIGWIVDLRNSRGGNTWPALTGIGSLLGEGTAGFFVDAAGQATAWGYTGGATWMGTPDKPMRYFLEAPHKLITRNPQVAVLTDIGVASSGEAIAIAFRGRPQTRSFGTPTCGLSTSIQAFPLSNGAALGIMVSVMADRTKRQYGGPVVPDELVSAPADVVPRAVAWLKEPK
jgi:hypothetical protein